MEVLPRCGHCVHEDAPDKVSKHTVLASEDLLITPLVCILEFVDYIQDETKLFLLAAGC